MKGRFVGGGGSVRAKCGVECRYVVYYIFDSAIFISLAMRAQFRATAPPSSTRLCPRSLVPFLQQRYTSISSLWLDR